MGLLSAVPNEVRVHQMEVTEAREYAKQLLAKSTRDYCSARSAKLDEVSMGGELRVENSGVFCSCIRNLDWHGPCKLQKVMCHRLPAIVHVKCEWWVCIVVDLNERRFQISRGLFRRQFTCALLSSAMNVTVVVGRNV